MLRPALTGLWAIVLVAICPAQATNDVHGLPGKRAGTELWIVQFERRSFDLSRFRSAILARRPAEEVNAIVAELERKVVADQAAFVRKVETDYGAIVLQQWWLVNACYIEVDPKHLPAIGRLPNVQRLQPDEEAFPVIKKSTDIRNHNSDYVHKLNQTGKGVTVAIVDTGQDEKMAGGNRPHRTYFVNGDPKNTTGTGIGNSRLILNKQIGTQPADDVHRHGTGVASIVAGGNWGISAADNGHAYDANIAGYAIANSLSGSTTLAVMATAWQTVAKDRAQHNIVTANLSYSGKPQVTSVEQQAMDSAAFNADIMTCVAAGNFRTSTASSQSCANGLATAAINADSHTMASFSSIGPLYGSGGRFYPDLSGCGVSTVMALRDNEGSSYVGSGTSMASPQTCGTAALVRSANPKLTALETKSILLASTQSIAKENPGKTRNNYGMGMVRADLAVLLAQKSQGFGTGTLTTTSKTVRVPIPVTKGTQYAVCISWHRSKFSSSTYSNLDFRLLDGTAVVGESKTPKNLYEMIRFLAGKTSTYVLEVTGTFLDVASLKFSYAYTETPPEPIAGTVSRFGKGCLGNGFPPGFSCQSENQQTTGLQNSNGSTPGDIYLIEVTAKQDLLVEGFDIRSKAAGSSPQNINTYVFDAKSSGAPNTVLASSTMKIDVPLANYRTTFTQSFQFKTNTVFFLGIEVPRTGTTQLVLPVVSSGTTTPFWIKDVQGEWRRITQTRWVYNVFCKVTKPGAVPDLNARSAPALDNRLYLDLLYGLPDAQALLLVGLSDQTWGGLKLPFEVAPNCSILVSGELLLPLKLSSGGGFTHSYKVPNNKNLLGRIYYHQVGILDPNANVFGYAMSNALRLQVGEF